MIEISINIKNEDGQPEGFIIAVDPMTLRLFNELHNKEPYAHVLEIIHQSLDVSKNEVAVKMKAIIEDAVKSVPEEEVVKQLSNIVSKGE